MPHNTAPGGSYFYVFRQLTLIRMRVVPHYTVKLQVFSMILLMSAIRDFPTDRGGFRG